MLTRGEFKESTEYLTLLDELGQRKGARRALLILMKYCVSEKNDFSWKTTITCDAKGEFKMKEEPRRPLKLKVVVDVEEDELKRSCGGCFYAVFRLKRFKQINGDKMDFEF